jgi:hypothetical protein
MTYFLVIGGAFALVLAYLSGRYRGFSEGYFAAVFDQTVAVQVEEESDDAYLAVYGDQIEAGRKGRN